MIDLLQPRFDKTAVFAAQRDNIGDGAEADKIRKLRKQLRHLLFGRKRADQFERDADAGPVLEFARAIAAVRVDHRFGARQMGADLVVVGHNEFHAKVIDVFRFFQRGNAVIHGDDQLDAVLKQTVDRLAVQAVALAVAVGDVAHHIRADHFKIKIQQRRSRDAVRVIVAVNRDALPCVQRKLDRLHGLVHIADGKRIAKRGRIVQKRADLRFFGDAAGRQQQRRKRVDLIGVGNLRGKRFIHRRDVPLFSVHPASLPCCKDFFLL